MLLGTCYKINIFSYSIGISRLKVHVIIGYYFINDLSQKRVQKINFLDFEFKNQGDVTISI